MRDQNDENEDLIDSEKCSCNHGEDDMEGFEKETFSSESDGLECRHEKVVPVISWKKEGAREMIFRFFCITCRIQFERTIQPQERHCGKCGESYFYYPYSPQ